LTGSGTTPVVFIFDRSLDATNWVASSLSFSATPAGTGHVVTITNLSIVDAGWLKLTSIQNANASAVTNLVLKYASKK